MRVFRYFTTTAMAYFAGVVIFGQVQMFMHLSTEELAVQFYLNLWTYAILLGYLSISWFRHKLGKYYLPVAIIFSTAIPIFSNLIYLVDADTTDLASLITRSWLLFPILLVPLVITAWQYRLRQRAASAARKGSSPLPSMTTTRGFRDRFFCRYSIVLGR